MKSVNQLPGQTTQETEYYNQLQHQNIIQPEHLLQAEEHTQNSQNKFMEDISQGIVIIEEEKNINEKIKKRSDQAIQNKAQQAKLQKLEDAQKQKELLEKKLYLLEHNITELKSDKKRQEKHPNPNSADLLDETEEQREKREEKLRALIKDRDEREERRKRKIQEELEKQKQKEEDERQRKDQLRMEKHLHKKQELEEKYKQMQIKQREKQLERKEQEVIIKQILSKKPKYVENTEKFNEQEQKLLEQKKQQLSHIRNLHKPIDKEEILEHQRQYEQFKQQKKQRYEQNKQDTKFNYNKPYQSENYKRFQEELKHIKIDCEKKAKKPIPIRHNKIKSYVKTINKPNIDPKLVQERERNVENSKNTSILAKEKVLQNGGSRLRAQSLKEIGNDYLKYSRQKIKKRDSDDEDNHSFQDDEKIIMKKNDYIEEMRKKRMEQEKSDKIRGVSNFEKIVKNNHINNDDKEIIMMMEAERLQSLAQQKERLIKIKGKFNAIGTEEDNLVDEYLMKAVQAKMAIFKLDEQHNESKQDSD